MINGYFPIALTFKTRVYSTGPSASLTIIDAINTLASVDLKVIDISCLFLGLRTPVQVRIDQ